MIEPTVTAVCMSDKKGVSKTPVDEITVKINHGVVGDAHAGEHIRQVSLLADESIDRLRDKLPNITAGTFAENILTIGICLYDLPVGTKLRIGNALMKVSKIGKECHEGACEIKQQTGDCCMPREGVFAEVLEDGKIKPGDKIVVEE